MGPRADGRVPGSMARRARHRGVEACTCHTPGLKTQIPRQGGVGTFPGNFEMLRLFCNISGHQTWNCLDRMEQLI